MDDLIHNDLMQKQHFPPSNPNRPSTKEVAILLALIVILTLIGIIPDPLPYVDEILMYLIGFGLYGYWYNRKRQPPTE